MDTLSRTEPSVKLPKAHTTTTRVKKKKKAAGIPPHLCAAFNFFLSFSRRTTQRTPQQPKLIIKYVCIDLCALFFLCFQRKKFWLLDNMCAFILFSGIFYSTLVTYSLTPPAYFPPLSLSLSPALFYFYFSIMFSRREQGGEWPGMII